MAQRSHEALVDTWGFPLENLPPPPALASREWSGDSHEEDICVLEVNRSHMRGVVAAGHGLIPPTLTT